MPFGELRRFSRAPLKLSSGTDTESIAVQARLFFPPLLIK